jgi:hypothetical protein
MAYFWGIPPLPFFLAHVTFEVVENTEAGMEFINKTHLLARRKAKGRFD